jgi:hypothetical protein
MRPANSVTATATPTTTTTAISIAIATATTIIVTLIQLLDGLSLGGISTEGKWGEEVR